MLSMASGFVFESGTTFRNTFRKYSSSTTASPFNTASRADNEEPDGRLAARSHLVIDAVSLHGATQRRRLP